MHRHGKQPEPFGRGEGSRAQDAQQKHVRSPVSPLPQYIRSIRIADHRNPSVANPFTANSRERAANEIALDKHQRERAQADATRKEAYGSTARAQAQQRDLQGNIVRQGGSGKDYANRSKYQFEADSEDDEMENEIDENLEAIHRGAKTLNMLGKAMGDEIDTQNKHIDRIIGKTDKVDDQIALNRARLDRIR